MSQSLKNQVLPILVAILAFVVLSFLYYTQVQLLNLLPFKKILTDIKWADILVGLTIYLKTSIDFALLIGILMSKFPGFKNRVAIEIGTAAGNALGTMLVLVVWFFFKEVFWLLALMILFASLVLFKLAKTSLDHVALGEPGTEVLDQHEKLIEPNPLVARFAKGLSVILIPINKVLDPFLSRVMPDLDFKADKVQGFGGLFLASFTIPFILGMDDFAGYVPLFNVVNVFGFGIGVFLGHMILNIFLFLNPDRTIRIIKNPIIAVIGSTAFIALGAWGIYEAGHLVIEHYLIQK